MHFFPYASELIEDDMIVVGEETKTVGRVDKDQEWAGELPIGYEDTVHVYFKDGTDDTYPADMVFEATSNSDRA